MVDGWAEAGELCKHQDVSVKQILGILGQANLAHVSSVEEWYRRQRRWFTAALLQYTRPCLPTIQMLGHSSGTL